MRYLCFIYSKQLRGKCHFLGRMICNPNTLPFNEEKVSISDIENHPSGGLFVKLYIYSKIDEQVRNIYGQCFEPLELAPPQKKAKTEGVINFKELDEKLSEAIRERFLFQSTKKEG